MNIPIKTNHLYFLLLVLFVVGLLCACGSPASAPNPPKEPLGPPDRVDVVYFYQGQACSCVGAMGERIYATVWLNFQDELASGQLTFQRFDLDDEENVTIAEKYNAAPLSLFINMVRGDAEHIITVPEILSVQYDEEALAELVKSKIRQSLNGEDEDFDE